MVVLFFLDFCVSCFVCRSDNGIDKQLKLIYNLLFKVFLQVSRTDTQNKYIISTVELILKMINNDALSGTEMAKQLTENLSRWVKQDKNHETSGATSLVENLVSDANEGIKSWKDIMFNMDFDMNSNDILTIKDLQFSRRIAFVVSILILCFVVSHLQFLRFIFVLCFVVSHLQFLFYVFCILFFGMLFTIRIILQHAMPAGNFVHQIPMMANVGNLAILFWLHKKFNKHAILDVLKRLKQCYITYERSELGNEDFEFGEDEQINEEQIDEMFKHDYVREYFHRNTNAASNLLASLLKFACRNLDGGKYPNFETCHDSVVAMFHEASVLLDINIVEEYRKNVDEIEDEHRSILRGIDTDFFLTDKDKNDRYVSAERHKKKLLDDLHKAVFCGWNNDEQYLSYSLDGKYMQKLQQRIDNETVLHFARLFKTQNWFERSTQDDYFLPIQASEEDMIDFSQRKYRLTRSIYNPPNTMKNDLKKVIGEKQGDNKTRPRFDDQKV